MSLFKELNLFVPYVTKGVGRVVSLGTVSPLTTLGIGGCLWQKLGTTTG